MLRYLIQLLRPRCLVKRGQTAFCGRPVFLDNHHRECSNHDMANASELLRTIKLLWFNLTWPRYKFRLLKRTLPTVRIRPFEQADLEICCDIYKLNAPGRFPEGYYDIFRGAITSPNTLFLVVENEGTVLGFGGISLSLLETHQEAKISYGIIHPDAHRKGIGTALLLARIAALPEPDKPYVLTVSPLPHSRSFFKQFGFCFANKYQDTRTNKKFELLAVRVTRQDWLHARKRLSQASVELMVTEAVPVVPIDIANRPYVVL
jgi:N-acetylglutamate synthase-like GNAT family acetyltransferase